MYKNKTLLFHTGSQKCASSACSVKGLLSVPAVCCCRRATSSQRRCTTISWPLVAGQLWLVSTAPPPPPLLLLLLFPISRPCACGCAVSRQQQARAGAGGGGGEGGGEGEGAEGNTAARQETLRCHLLQFRPPRSRPSSLSSACPLLSCLFFFLFFFNSF